MGTVVPNDHLRALSWERLKQELVPKSSLLETSFFPKLPSMVKASAVFISFLYQTRAPLFCPGSLRYKTGLIIHCAKPGCCYCQLPLENIRSVVFRKWLQGGRFPCVGNAKERKRSELWFSSALRQKGKWIKYYIPEAGWGSCLNGTAEDLKIPFFSH